MREGIVREETVSDEIVFHHNPRSRAAIAHWMLEEVGAPYRIVPVSFEAGETRTPDFLAINPMGKLPVIQHRGRVVTETPAILAYLADAFPEAGLAPDPGSPERGAYYRWLFFGAAAFEPALIDAMMGRPEVSRSTAGWGTYEDVMATLRGVLGGLGEGYLAGAAFSAADLYVASELSWAGMFGAPGIKGDPVLDAYVARCTDRPAARRANAGA